MERRRMKPDFDPAFPNRTNHQPSSTSPFQLFCSICVNVNSSVETQNKTIPTGRQGEHESPSFPQRTVIELNMRKYFQILAQDEQLCSKVPWGSFAGPVEDWNPLLPKISFWNVLKFLLYKMINTTQQNSKRVLMDLNLIIITLPQLEESKLI